MADGLEHPLHLVLASFVEHELHPARVEQTRLGRCGPSVVELDALAELRERALFRPTLDNGLVDLLDAVPRMRETVCELAVVRQEERAGRVGIEPADRHDARLARDELHHGAPSVRVARGRDDAGGLVEKQVREPLLRHRRAVDFDVVVRADERVQLTGPAVDGDAAGLDQVVGSPTRRDAGAGKERVQPHPVSIGAVSTQGRHEGSRYFVSRELPVLLRERAQAEPPRVLADLGAGEGAILYALDRAGLVGERIYAVDLSERALAVAASLSEKVAPIVADVSAVSALEDESVDAVTSSQVIEHVPDEHAFVTEIARVLRPGGWFYVSSVVRGPHAWWFRRGPLGWQIDPTHIREYASEAAFSASLAEPRLELERVRSEPLRFPVADPALRLLAAARVLPQERLASAYERSPALALARRALRVRVPGYRWVEAVGHKRRA